jgi:Undecaprenyl-phosphate galactose phosphotransferase WbaP
MSIMKSLFTRAAVSPSQLTASSAAAPPPVMGPSFSDFDAPAETEAQSAPPQSRQLQSGAKRTFDLVAALILIMLLSPVLVVIALLVMRDGGPCVFGHTRIGNGGVKFRCLKFRSMVVNADVVLKQLLDTDPQARAEWDRDFKLKHDVRITKVGHFIRRTSLDELPQLWNVVRGEMSLVGPRPVIEKELERYGAGAEYYLKAKPGITGLWQVSGRNDIDYATRVALDVAYVTNWSFGSDIMILVRTIGVVLSKHGAY